MSKTVAIITYDPLAVESYACQVKALFGDTFKIDTYTIRDGSINFVNKADLYLISKGAFESLDDIDKYLPLDGESVEIRLTFTKETLRRLSEVPKGTRAMFVNLSRKTATEGITRLVQLGINHIDFVPVYPGMEPISGPDLAVTPGETRYVPPFVKRIVDIGARVLDAATVVEIALKLHMESLLEQSRIRDYLNSIADNSYNFDLLFGRSRRLESRFEILMSILDEGIIGVNEENTVFACSPKVERVLGVKRNLVLDKAAREVFPGIPFDECAESLCEIKSRLIKVSDTDISLSVTPVIRGGKYVGAFAVVKRFTDEEYNQHKLRIQLLNKGHKAKYVFEDIIGESPAMKKCCVIAKKMAVTGGAILITGESGTGKELFAHAIHNHSPRRDYPFVAVNCAAITDSLLESELFGYEEGAFTGAKKGGKLGLFEFAHKGTLFLDEIEGMSSNLQVKLLRVIQEKEVLRVGGNKIITVDVRIVAATNENLTERVEKGSFRRDLYFRLNTLPIMVPPLRERSEDIMLLFERFKAELGGKFLLSEEARAAFRRHEWCGNVRELRNYAEYLTYMDLDAVEYDDLPQDLKRGRGPKPRAETNETEDPEIALMIKTMGSRLDDYRFILNQLFEACESRIPLGRKALARQAERKGIFLSEQEVRGLLTRLDEYRLVKLSRGRGGSKITQKGIRFLKRAE